MNVRLFVGLDIPEQIRAAVTSYIEECRRVAPEARWVKPESLHITLKFIGETQKVDEIKDVLAQVTAHPFEIELGGTGFFTPGSPRVFWVGIKASDALPELAHRIDEATARVGIPREEHPFRPHLTLARVGSGRPQGTKRDRSRPKMYNLRDKIGQSSATDFGTMTAQEFFLYQSKLSPAGAKYTKLARFALE